MNKHYTVFSPVQLYTPAEMEIIVSSDVEYLNTDFKMSAFCSYCNVKHTKMDVATNVC